MYKVMLDKIICAFLLCVIVISLQRCVNAPSYPIEPVIAFESFDKSSMIQGLNIDTILMSISFTDGDGDLGFEGFEQGTNLTMIDNRTGVVYNEFKIPKIPEQGANNGVSGVINIKVLTTCCIFPEATMIPPCSVVETFPDNDFNFAFI